MSPLSGRITVRPKTTWTARRVLLYLMWLVTGIYAVLLIVVSLGWAGPLEATISSATEGWLGVLSSAIPVGVCWLAVHQLRYRCPEAVLGAAAITSHAVSDAIAGTLAIEGEALPFPSIVDVGYLLVYPLLLAALIVTVRRYARGPVLWVRLDCIAASLGAGAVLAVVMQPVLDSSTSGLSPLAVFVAVAAPVCDLVLITAVAGMFALRGVELGGRWALLAAGLLLFAGADVVAGLQLTGQTYALGSPTDAAWDVGMALMAMWVAGAGKDKGLQERPARAGARMTALTVSSCAALAGVAILLRGTQVPLPDLAVWLAAGALLAAVGRAQLAARLLERMADDRLVAAATDELTGLPNRRAFYAEAQTRLADVGAERRALLMLDLDGFKDVNDGLGHRAGDEVLVEVGSRLRAGLRYGDLLARLGGDEFAILLADARDEHAVEVATRLCAALGEPMTVADTSLRVGVSIGIAMFPDDGPDLSVLLRKADIAMYRAKTSQLAHHVYSAADDVDAAALLQTVQELRSAAAEGQFVLHYQPKVDLDTGEVHSVEALVRWDHPTRGLLAPDAFLHLVEEFGLMPLLTTTVLGQALDQVAAWRRDGQLLTVAVNLSSVSLADPGFPGLVASMLAARGVEPSALQLEITERFLVTDRDLARIILTRLRESGVRISVDDFGTGYNSLAYLLDLPIDELKLDRSFVTPMTHDVRTAAMVSSTIELAHNLGMRIVAEGVETESAYDELARMGCDQAQGYFMSRPIPAAEICQWVTKWNELGSSASSVPAVATTVARRCD